MFVVRIGRRGDCARCACLLWMSVASFLLWVSVFSRVQSCFSQNIRKVSICFQNFRWTVNLFRYRPSLHQISEREVHFQETAVQSPTTEKTHRHQFSQVVPQSESWNVGFYSAWQLQYGTKFMIWFTILHLNRSIFERTCAVYGRRICELYGIAQEGSVRCWRGRSSASSRSDVRPSTRCTSVPSWFGHLVPCFQCAAQQTGTWKFEGEQNKNRVFATTCCGSGWRLLCLSLKGSLFTYEPEENTGVKPLTDVHHGAFIGADMLCPGDEYCVVRSQGKTFGLNVICLWPKPRVIWGCAWTGNVSTWFRTYGFSCVFVFSLEEKTGRFKCGALKLQSLFVRCQ